MPTPDSGADEGSEERADEPMAGELARLRSLVGPSERSYRAAIADAEQAIAEARRATLELGEARGELAVLRVDLERARQQAAWARRRGVGGLARRLVGRARQLLAAQTGSWRGWREARRP